jgi:light-regulated signal transduction histidine kinase (bacteriophytochrome)
MNGVSAPIDAGDLVEAVLADLRPGVEEKCARITQDPLPRVLGVESQIRLVFQNLIANALKFHPEGTVPRIHIGARVEGRTCTFLVKDNGIGIESRYADRVFVIFQRLNTRDAYPGTGLGLAITKKILDRHGGRIWFESKPGEGTTFHFTLTIAPAAGSLTGESPTTGTSRALQSSHSN